MTPATSTAPGWAHQPAPVPNTLARPVVTPAARALLRATGTSVESLVAGGHGADVIRLRDVERRVGHTDRQPSRTVPHSIAVSAQLPRATSPEQRLARAAIAAVRMLRQADPAPCHARFRLPALRGESRDLVIEAIENLTEEAVVRRLRTKDTQPPVDSSNDGIVVALELMDLTGLAIEEITLEPQHHLVLALGAPVAQVTPLTTGSTTLAVVDTLRLTVAPGGSTTLETAAAVLGAVKASISQGGTS